MNENAKDETVESPTLAHVIPVQVLVAAFLALMVLTAVTVGVSYFDFGSLNLLVAVGVATIKASVVALYFMHLRYDSPFNGLIFVTAVIFLALFLSITLLDTIEYQGEIDTFQESET